MLKFYLSLDAIFLHAELSVERMGESRRMGKWAMPVSEKKTLGSQLAYSPKRINDIASDNHMNTCDQIIS